MAKSRRVLCVHTERTVFGGHRSGTRQQENFGTIYFIPSTLQTKIYICYIDLFYYCKYIGVKHIFSLLYCAVTGFFIAVSVIFFIREKRLKRDVTATSDDLLAGFFVSLKHVLNPNAESV